MMKILTGSQMSQVDRLTVELVGIPFATLMETAGVSVARVVEECLAGAQESWGGAPWWFMVVCGKGNNGGDGAVVARHLWLRRLGRVEVFLVGRLEEMRGEARANVEIVRSIAKMDSSLGYSEVYRDLPSVAIGGDRLVIIDALFGTGLARRVEGVSAAMIELVNGLRTRGAMVVSIDLPSGLASDSGEVQEPHVRADLTVTLTAPKIANIVQPAASSSGRLVVAPIGSPESLIDQVLKMDEVAGADGALELVEKAWVGEWLEWSRREVTAHKGAVGRVMLIAGGSGRTGAAALAAGAVLRSGAGLVTVGTPVSALPLLVSQCDSEVMTRALPETPGGGFGLDSLEAVAGLAESWDALAIGPGIRSGEDETRLFVRRLVERRRGPVVIDADGLNALAPWPADLRGSPDLPIVITPHPGEMARLAGMTIAEIEQDRIGVARRMARQHQLIVVLKGAGTVIADPSGRVVINSTGNEGMATAGAGDVLTGLLAGLLAQRPMPALEAVMAGVWLHGKAGDLAAVRCGKRSMIASDIRDQIGEAIIAVGGSAEGRGGSAGQLS
ncbi:MAG: hypothetical protein RIR52_1204 [Acidobacteriota bacterium]